LPFSLLLDCLSFSFFYLFNQLFILLSIFHYEKLIFFPRGFCNFPPVIARFFGIFLPSEVMFLVRLKQTRLSQFYLHTHCCLKEKDTRRCPSLLSEVMAQSSFVFSSLSLFGFSLVNRYFFILHYGKSCYGSWLQFQY